MSKKKIIIISIAALLLVASITVSIILLTNKDDTPDDTPTPIIPHEVVKLSRPKGLKREGTILTWDEVPNASGYLIKVNDLEYISETNSYDLSTVIVEGANLSVTAIGKDTYKNSVAVKLTPYITIKDENEINHLYDFLKDFVKFDANNSEIVNITKENAEELFFIGVKVEDFTQIESFIEELNNLLEGNYTVSELLEKVLEELGKLNSQFSNEAVLTKGLFLIVEHCFEVIVALNDTEENKLELNSLLNPHYEINSVELGNKVLTFLNSIDLYQYESCQVLFGYLGKYFYALEQQLPGILNVLLELEDADDDFVSSDIDMMFDAFSLKDEIVSVLLDEMPDYNDFMGLYNILLNGFDACCPESLKDANPFKLLEEDLENIYLDNHYMLSYLKYLDADFVGKVKEMIQDVTDNINYEKINELRTYLKTENYVFLASEISKLACMNNGKLDYEKAAQLNNFLFQIMTDLSNGDEGFMTWIEGLIQNNLDKAISKLMYQEIISDELLELIFNLATLSETSTLEEIAEALSLSEYFKLKEGKTTEELKTALNNITSEMVEDVLAIDFSNFTIEEVLLTLGLSDLLEVNFDGYLEYLETIFDDSNTFLTYLFELESFEQLFNDLEFNAAIEEFFNGIWADLILKYPILEDSSEYLINLLSSLGIDLVTIGLNIQELDTLLENKEINFKFIYKKPTTNHVEVEEDYFEKVVKNFVLYGIFGHRAALVEKDVDSLIDLLEYYQEIIEENAPSQENIDAFIDELLVKLNNPLNLDELIDNVLNMSQEEINSIFDFILSEYEELFGFSDLIEVDKLESFIDAIISQLPDDYKENVEEFFNTIFDEILNVSFETRLEQLRDYLLENQEITKDIYELYKTSVDFSNLELEKIESYYHQFIEDVNFDEYTLDEFVLEYETNEAYQVLVDEAFDEMLLASSESIELIIEEFLKLETEVEKIPEVSSEVLTIFDSLEELKTNINDYERFKENVVSFIEELYYLIN